MFLAKRGISSCPNFSLSILSGSPDIPVKDFGQEALLRRDGRICQWEISLTVARLNFVRERWIDVLDVGPCTCRLKLRLLEILQNVTVTHLCCMLVLVISDR